MDEREYEIRFCRMRNDFYNLHMKIHFGQLFVFRLPLSHCRDDMFLLTKGIQVKLDDWVQVLMTLM